MEGIKFIPRFFVKGFVFSSGVVFLFFILFLVFKFLFGLDRLKILKNSFFLPESLQEQDYIVLKTFIEKGRIVSFDSIFTQTLSYYDALITILIGLLGIVVAGAFFYIKTASEEKNKEYAKTHTDNFFKTIEFKNLFDSSIKKQIEEWGEDITEGFDRIKRLEERVFSLEEDSKKGSDEKIKA